MLKYMVLIKFIKFIINIFKKDIIVKPPSSTNHQISIIDLSIGIDGKTSSSSLSTSLGDNDEWYAF